MQQMVPDDSNWLLTDKMNVWMCLHTKNLSAFKQMKKRLDFFNTGI